MGDYLEAAREMQDLWRNPDKLISSLEVVLGDKEYGKPLLRTARTFFTKNWKALDSYLGSRHTTPERLEIILMGYVGFLDGQIDAGGTLVHGTSSSFLTYHPSFEEADQEIRRKKTAKYVSDSLRLSKIAVRRATQNLALITAGGDDDMYKTISKKTDERTNLYYFALAYTVLAISDKLKYLIVEAKKDRIEVSRRRTSQLELEED